jgi:hypothetical protein
MEQDVPLTLRMHAEALRSARAGVTDPEAIALLDQAIRLSRMPPIRPVA